MSTLPSPTEVSGKHNGIYEAYYKQVDPKGVGKIEAMSAAKFLKKSGLSDVVLSRIWDLSDPKGRGYLDKGGFFVALKLVALAQHGHDIHMRNIYMEPPMPPKVGEIPKLIIQTIQSVPASNTDWSMKPSDRLKYEQLFESLDPVNGLIAGNKVKGVLMESKLPLETLGRIWDLADQDKDGSLDKHEFTVAMHLVYQALDKRAVPTTLPPELQKSSSSSSSANTITKTLPKAPSGEGFNDGGFVANFPKDIAPPVQPPAIPPSITSVRMSRPPQPSAAALSMNVNLLSGIASPVVPPSIKPITSTTGGLDWVVTAQDRIRFENIFRDCDKDKDGLVSGIEVKNVFLNSGVPQNCLAHIWALCDTNQSGKLTLEQFALAMWMVEQKIKGVEPPEVLAPNMIPPSLRTSNAGTDVPLMQTEPPQPRYSNPELEMIAKEIDELFKERSAIETDIAQKEADVRIKTGEIRSLQSELDTLAATLKQLENQKGEAQKRLDDLTIQVSKIREQCQKQEETINEQEGELNSKRSELQKLKDEETACEKELNSLRKEIDNLSKQLQDKQLESSQVKAMITELLENQRQMNDTILLCKAAIETNDIYLVSDYSLKIEPNLHEARDVLQKLNEPKQQQQQQQQLTTDPFNENTSTNDSFGGTDAFTSNGFTSDPFTATTKMKNETGFDDSFMNAPLGGFDDAFGSSFSTTNQTKDPFMSSSADPFGDKKISNITNESGKDDFGSDPFAILHAPTSGGQILSPNPQKSGPPPRPESPSPALPPKKSKQPPPRPAPPRPLQGPTRPAPPQTATTDAFGSSTGGFADFADFDDKRMKLLRPICFRPFSSSPSSLTSSTFTTTTTTATAAAASASPSSSATTIKNNQQTKKLQTPPTTSSAITLSSEILNKISTTSTRNISNKASSSIKIPSPSPSPLPPHSSAVSVPAPSPASTINFSFPCATAPTDFVDDPFKDYRYEDPFNIHDPFDDNAGDGYHGNESKENKPISNNNHKTFPESDDDNNKDFFDKFDDDFKKFDNKTKTSTTNGNSSIAYDAFGGSGSDAVNSSSSNSNKLKNLNTTFNFDEDDFGSDFNQFKIYDDNSNKTELTLAKTLSTITTTNTTISTTNTNTSTINENFASFDLFENVKDIQNFYLNNNNNTATKNDMKFKKITNNDIKLKSIDYNKKSEKIPDKYANDYSVSDTFNDDLEAAIQRSMIEK